MFKHLALDSSFSKVDHLCFCFLNVPTPASFSLYKQSINFLQQVNVKQCHVHPVYSGGTSTHNLSNMSRLP